MKEAAEYIESLPDYRRASINVGYARLENRRRKAVGEGGCREYYAQAICARIESEISNQICFMTRCHKHIDLDTAIEQAINELKEFINNKGNNHGRSGQAKRTM